MTDLSPAVWRFGLAFRFSGGFTTRLGLGWRDGARTSVPVAVLVSSALRAAAGREGTRIEVVLPRGVATDAASDQREAA